MSDRLRKEIDPRGLPERFAAWNRKLNEMVLAERVNNAEDLVSIRLDYRYIPVFPPPERERLAKVSEAKRVMAHRSPIQLFRARSLDDYFAFVEYYCAYANLSDSISRCYFRGQTEDYNFSVLPSAERSLKFAQELRGGAPEIVHAIDAWQRVLKSEGVVFEQGRTVETETETGTWYAADSSLGSKITRNLEFMGILQHYGFPTFALDVTDDPGIALWFALHRASEKDGKVRFRPLRASGNSSPGYPLVYVFLGVDHESGEVPVIDLHTMSYFQQKSPNRAFSQRATVLPKYRSEFIQSLHDQTMMSLEPGLSPPGRFREVLCRNGPSGAIRIEFPVDELKEKWPAMSTGSLFPPNDQLYKALNDAAVPYLYRAEL